MASATARLVVLVVLVVLAVVDLVALLTQSARRVTLLWQRAWVAYLVIAIPVAAVATVATAAICNQPRPAHRPLEPCWPPLQTRC